TENALLHHFLDGGEVLEIGGTGGFFRQLGAVSSREAAASRGDAGLGSRLLFSGGRGFVHEDGFDGAELDAGSVAQHGFGDGGAVDVGAIGGPLVLKLEGSTQVVNHRMGSGKGGVFQHEVIARIASDRE